MTLDEMISEYKALREKRAEVDSDFKTKIGLLQASIEVELTGAGLASARTNAGMAIMSTRRSMRVADWVAFNALAVEYPELIKRSLDTTEALRLIDDNIALPGVEVSSTLVLTVR